MHSRCHYCQTIQPVDAQTRRFKPHPVKGFRVLCQGSKKLIPKGKGK